MYSSYQAVPSSSQLNQIILVQTGVIEVLSHYLLFHIYDSRLKAHCSSQSELLEKAVEEARLYKDKIAATNKDDSQKNEAYQKQLREVKHVQYLFTVIYDITCTVLVHC